MVSQRLLHSRYIKFDCTGRAKHMAHISWNRTHRINLYNDIEMKVRNVTSLDFIRQGDGNHNSKNWKSWETFSAMSMTATAQLPNIQKKKIEQRKQH